MKNKLKLYTYTLGNDKKDCKVDEGVMYCQFWETKKEAKREMKKNMKEVKYKHGTVIKITIEKD